jgi:hypothetical protein
VAEGETVSSHSPTEEDRARYLHLLDGARQRGLLGDGEYGVRVVELYQAESFDKLNEIVQQLPALAGTADQKPRKPKAPVVATTPVLTSDELSAMSKLDPVDLARLSSAKSAHKASPGNKWVALAVVAFMFVVLIVLGVLLAAHTRSTNDGLLHLQAARHLSAQITGLG